MQTAPVTADNVEHPMRLPESLRPWITEAGYIPIVRYGAEPFAHVPQAVTTIALHTDASGRRDALVLGPRTRATYARADKNAGCLRLRLAPGATRPLLGVSAADITDRVVRLGQLPGVVGELADALLELGPHDALAYLEETLPQRLSEDPTQRAHRALLNSAVTALSTTAAPVHRLASTLAVSERQLRNLFTTGVGVSPKHYARINRVRHVIEQAGNTPWSQIATATGYYDQSHMAADFRTLMGVPPARFFRGDLPAPTPCRSISRV
ncbi:helix-turn-helix domain-containing protein [Nocardia arthritidis]|uniref:Helix-turn-helix domain-containing protein n=1 Tax=Nocardia arthritidis TaxID=228602 RepID=A0A6G9Y4R4_9NOCA|nr:helix-turn-helix domain-containing protein [Nocardia arthritidis]QIS08063.1 helix-turn-helix domain-containing protein [Nocardia arthritidis]